MFVIETMQPATGEELVNALLFASCYQEVLRPTRFLLHNGKH
jgi:hypothetical protein